MSTSSTIATSLTMTLVLCAAASAAPLGVARLPAGATVEAGYYYTGAEYSVAVSTGRATRIGMFNDMCVHHVRPLLSGTADHGVVTTKDGTWATCGNANEPVTEVWYQSEAGFHGVDHITLLPYRSFITITVR